MERKRVIPYMVGNYAELVQDYSYFVDKTPYIAMLERIKNPIYLRPRRFGKTIFCSLLTYYYDLNAASRFDELFGDTWIGQHPTGKQNRFMILHLNFSGVEASSNLKQMEQNFKIKCNTLLNDLRQLYPTHLGEMPIVDIDHPVSNNMNRLISYITSRHLPPLYVIIDEYDNFANQLITDNKDQLYYNLTGEGSFFKTFFKTLKEGREQQAIAHLFITGVLPVTMDDLASAFNVGTYLTLEQTFEAMVGFTQTEVDHLLDQVYTDYALEPATRPEIAALIKNHYDGYHFASHEGEPLYNATSLMYFLYHLTSYKRLPESLTDLNLKTDLQWVRSVTGRHAKETEAFIETLNTKNQIPYGRNLLVTKFNLSQFFAANFYSTAFFYLGMLTLLDNFFLTLPNISMREIFVQYFNELNRIDVETRYSEMMTAFVNRPNLERLFAGYWREYVSQLPEVIFQKVNENFYRTTFYELCSRYLSRWFSWHLERSYPQGKSDLEFVGKYNEKYANLRWVIEFKYYSNSEFAKLKSTLEDFQLQADDTAQIKGYAEGLQQEFPRAQIELYVIYCIGNQGFRVFQVE